MNVRILGLAAFIPALAGCSSDPTQPPAGAIISIADYAFTDDSISVKAGTVVEWMNNGPSTHTVTSDSSVWTSQTLGPPGGGGGYGTTAGGTFRFTFATAGVYPYHCSIHSQMTGKVVVTP